MKTGRLSLPAYVLAASIILVFVQLPASQAACSISGCGSGGETWTQTAQAFIDSDVPIVGVTSANSASSASSAASSFRAGTTAANASNSSNASDNSTAAPLAVSGESSRIVTKKVSSSSGYSFQAGPEGGSAADSSANGTAASGTTASKPAVAGVYVAPGSRADQFPEDAAQILKALDAVSEDEVVLDVAARSSGQAHLRGAVNVPHTNFFYENGSLRSIPELESLLGSAGIKDGDEVMVYSDTFASGEATAVLWALTYLGHEQARALDGGLDNWIGASLPLESLDAGPTTAAVYNASSPRTELLADYDYVISGQPQLVDARSFQEWGETKIGNATWISVESVLTEGRLKAGEELKGTFARLETERPVVVYSDDICEASVVWFALRVMGYDARVYRLEERARI